MSGWVLAEVEGQDITTHGAGVEDMDGSDSDDDGKMDGGFESAEMFEESSKRPLLLTGYSENLGSGKLRMLRHFVARLITPVSRCRRR